MSSLWTPGGERPINPRPDAPSSPASPVEGDEPIGGAVEGAELTEEQRAQAEAMAKELSEARDRLLETDVSTVLANHAMGIYELAAIHLTADSPKMDQARTAVDALAALIEGLEGRLGEAESTLTEALHQIRLAFVQRSKQLGESAEPTPDA